MLGSAARLLGGRLHNTGHDILVLEVLGDYCSRQRVGSVQQRVGSVHYQFKLPLEIFIWEAICTKQNMRRDIQLLCHNLVFYTGMKKNDCFLK